MKNFDQHYQQAEAELLKEAASIDPVYAIGFLNQYPEETKDRVGEWAIRYFAYLVFSRAGQAQFDEAVEAVQAENPELKGKALVDAARERIENTTGSAVNVDSTQVERVE